MCSEYRLSAKKHRSFHVNSIEKNDDELFQL